MKDDGDVAITGDVVDDGIMADDVVGDVKNDGDVTEGGDVVDDGGLTEA